MRRLGVQHLAELIHLEFTASSAPGASMDAPSTSRAPPPRLSEPGPRSSELDRNPNKS
jgi:hypothetical protein